MLRIVPFPHPALRFKSVPVQRIDDGLRRAARAMFRLMYEHRGVGLAANQVGLPFRFFVLNLTADPEQPGEERVFINPEIVKRHSTAENEEGCLSFPGLYAPVRRAKRVRVRSFDLDGNPFEVDAEDLLSRALQHETDHLHGRLFVDYLEGNARTAANPKIREVEARYRQEQAERIYPDDAEIRRRLEATAASGLIEVPDEPPAAGPDPAGA